MIILILLLVLVLTDNGAVVPGEIVSKREASAEPETQRESSRPRVEDSVESLLCQVAEGKATMNVEALTAAFLQKKLQKEIPASGNEPSLQAKVDESKALEWETLL